LVGCNAAGNNAYYVRDDLLVDSKVNTLSVNDAFVDSRFREARDSSGSLSFARGGDRITLINGMHVVNVLDDTEEVI